MLPVTTPGFWHVPVDSIIVTFTNGFSVLSLFGNSFAEYARPIIKLYKCIGSPYSAIVRLFVAFIISQYYKAVPSTAVGSSIYITLHTTHFPFCWHRKMNCDIFYFIWFFSHLFPYPHIDSTYDDCWKH